jgi:hypothetical protein
MTTIAYSDEFIRVLRRCEVDLWHLRPAHPTSLGLTIPDEIMAAAKLLGERLSAQTVDVMRAAIIIGVESLLGEADAAEKNRDTAGIDS